MASDFYLTIENINNVISPDHIRELLTSAFSLEIFQNSGILAAHGVSISIFREDDEASVFKNFYPDVCVSFRIDKFKQYDKGLDMMLKVVFWLMSHFEGDMILSRDDDEVLFQRISGKLIFSDDSEFWADAKLSLFNLPYQYQPDQMNACSV
ncbi:Uncharacterized protein dnm_043230 [Desulfonema magnum]|uniref:Uncharacterized protein n=2 Tax=Desulfonema magnum TaxID=45655 RepID=A0A975BMN1_9BACT|nr:Uncharacterized protein dnm_043230 [Desulfonema magnum]